MVNVIENRAVVELQPLTELAPGPSAGWLVGRVVVQTAADVAGYPNLLSADLPRELQALVPEATAADLDPAGSWRVEASLVGPGRLRVERTVG